MTKLQSINKTTCVQSLKGAVMAAVIVW